MFIELHRSNGEAFLVNTENIDIIKGETGLEDCKTRVIFFSSDVGIVKAIETYDEIKALLAGQVVAAAKGTGEE